MTRVAACCAAPATLSACGRVPSGAPTATVPPVADGSAAPTPVGPPLPDVEPIVRVRIRRVNGGKSLRIGTEGDWLELFRIPAGRRTVDEAPAAVAHAPIEIRRRHGKWSVVDARGFRLFAESDETIGLQTPDAGGAGAVMMDDRPYPGHVRFVAQPDRHKDAFDVVNHVALDDYLPGVLEKELYRHWHPNTFAAQAIAARSYTCAEHAGRAHRHYDLTNTARSQVYVGHSTHPRARRAVAGTRGLVLGHGGRLIAGYYSSCCGGLAATALDAISHRAVHDVPPLLGRPGPDVCQAADTYAWTIERDVDDVRRRLAAWGERRRRDDLAGLGALRSITVARRNAHGRPTAFRIDDGEGVTAELDAESTRRAVDYSGGGIASPKRRLYSANLHVDIDGSKARFVGAGHGHGVGLCQHGAQALALGGMSAEAIIGWYYPEVEIVSTYAERSPGGDDPAPLVA